ncbi:pilus assembly protein TadB (plasmid) [Paenibacillus thiaminolyticus]|uniref:pilus assembly protein TadB n=1 Tax=Paenibacillus thiaminolyticus TaxID=49283 RepID=UPI0023304C72|nr:pilus assembly protein TadB [Paenibacillus thiaminolyticus]WCF11412.1 pilus assembly protein TadB [Paenibacillus thiaminolyticus]
MIGSLLNRGKEYLGSISLLNGYNFLFISVIVVSVFIFVNHWKKQRRISELFRTKKRAKGEHPENRSKQMKYFLALRKKVDLYYVFNGNQSKADNLYIGIFIVELLLFFIFIAFKKFILALLFPLIVHWFALKALELASNNIHIYIKKELPIAIKHMIKVMTKTNDLKAVLYETSGNLREPLRSKFFNLSRRMITENHERALLEFAEDLDDTWIYALSFMLISYKENSKKTDIIKNLATLAEMIDNENYQQEKALIEKKPIVILNYSLVVISIVLFFGNLVFNDYAQGFFFGSTGGMLVFLIGCSAILGTVLLNLILSKKTF